ncbi:MAG: class I SAM-dependent methyltransferase [Bryobacteraceae bacterium]
MQCGQCKLVRLFPQPKPAELQQYYPQHYWYAPKPDRVEHLEESYRRFVLRDHVRFVRRAIEDARETGIILDVGCGGGLFLKTLKAEGHVCAGLDFSLDAAGVAWHTNGIPTVCGALSQAPLRSNSCAAITMFHVVEHLYDPIPYLTAAYELLRPNGRLVIQVPNAACWQFLLLGERWNGVDVPRHLINYRASDLENLLHHCGFKVVRRKHFSLRDNPAGLATSIAPSLDPMARRIRGVQETPRVKLLKDLVYFGLVVASLPFTLLEAACGAGSTIMMEARKRP